MKSYELNKFERRGQLPAMMTNYCSACKTDLEETDVILNKCYKCGIALNKSLPVASNEFIYNRRFPAEKLKKLEKMAHAEKNGQLYVLRIFPNADEQLNSDKVYNHGILPNRMIVKITSNIER